MHNLRGTKIIKHIIYIRSYGMSNVPKSPISSKAVTPSSSSSSSPPRSPSQPSPPMSPLPPPLQSELENNEESLQSEQKQEQQQEQQKPQPKQRKVQTAEEYAHQLSLWRSSGPQINTETWLYEDLDKLNPIENKVDSAKLLHACEKAYYLRDWHHCLQLCNLGARLFAVDLDQVGDAMKQDLQSTNRRKRLGKKHERSVVDLYDIKQRCSSRMKEKDAEQAFGS